MSDIDIVALGLFALVALLLWINRPSVSKPTNTYSDLTTPDVWVSVEWKSKPEDPNVEWTKR